MKFKIKLVTLATSIILSTSIALIGCGKLDFIETVGKEEVANLTWYTIGNEPKDLQLIQDEANKYLESKINVNIDMKFINYSDYTEKLSTIINSGEDYDLAFTCSWAGDYLGNAKKGAFLELDKYLDKEGKGMKEIIDERFWEGAKIDGNIYAVPNQKELGITPMWVFTKEYVEKYNIPYEKLHTLEDLEPWLKVIKENEPDVVPLYITRGFSPPQYFDNLLEAVGIEYTDIGLTIKTIFETDRMKSTLETLRRYYQAGYINSDAAITQDDNSIKRLVTKGDGQPYSEILWSKDLGYDVVSSNIMDTYITNSSTTGSMIAISKTSKNPIKSVEFLNLLNTDEYLRNLINYGIEGIHYEKIGENQIKLTDKAKDYSVGYYTVGNLFLTYVLDNEPVTKWEDFKKFNDESRISPALGFKFDASNVRTEIMEISNVMDEFKPIIYSGSVDIEEFLGRLNAKLKKQGMDKVIEEMQKQIDVWLKNSK